MTQYFYDAPPPPKNRGCRRIVAKSGAERMGELHDRRQPAGDQEMLVILPEDYQARFDRLRRQLNATEAETLCYLIDLAVGDDDDDDE